MNYNLPLNVQRFLFKLFEGVKNSPLFVALSPPFDKKFINRYYFFVLWAQSLN